jgi:putative transposase
MVRLTKAPLAGKKTGKSPVDRSKRGTKRSLFVEGGGVPIGLSVAGANRNDFHAA